MAADGLRVVLGTALGAVFTPVHANEKMPPVIAQLKMLPSVYWTESDSVVVVCGFPAGTLALC